MTVQCEWVYTVYLVVLEFVYTNFKSVFNMLIYYCMKRVSSEGGKAHCNLFSSGPQSHKLNFSHIFGVKENLHFCQRYTEKHFIY